MNNQNLKDNIFKAQGLFIEAIRPYIVSLLMQDFGNDWAKEYYTSLSEPQKENWLRALESGSGAETLIDYHNLRGFAISKKRLLMKDFGRDAHNLPTWFDEITNVRHKTHHHNPVEDFEVERAFNSMILISKKLGMTELVKSLENLKENKNPLPVAETAPASQDSSLMPWFHNVTPHLDIKQGNLDESVFAANLAEVSLGNGREIYQNPVTFFSKTYFTQGLKSVAKRVIKGLNGKEDAENRVISLQTGFGGGKTHTLISLYHIAGWGKQLDESASTKELIEYAGKPDFDKASVAVFTNKTNDPTQGRRVDGEHIRTMWGEIAWQLGGREAYEIIKPNDQNRTSPKGIFAKVLAKCKPALILVDELADYCVAAAGVEVGASTLADQTISFIQEISEDVAAIPQCVMVATLPQSIVEVGNSDKAQTIFTSLSDRFSRVSADTKPVQDEEIYEVIRRRLFEDIGNQKVIEQVVSSYVSMYQENWSELPSDAPRREYRDKLLKSYPFHPELIDMFSTRWASNHDFQRTRGVLRLMAAIISDLWQRRDNLRGVNTFIHTSDINFANVDALSSQLKKLWGNGYDAVISSDVSGSSCNARKIDDEKSDYGNHDLAKGIAATILLGSFDSSGAKRGVSISQIKLCVMKPKSFNHNNINGALDALEGQAHYLYINTVGSDKKYWFHTKPNIKMLINQAVRDIQRHETNAEIIKRIHAHEKNIEGFRVLINPTEEIPEQQKLTLVILGPQYLANPDRVNGDTKKLIKKIATKRGNSERIYRNTMLFLVCSEIGIARLRQEVGEYLASLKIRDEYKEQLENDQKEDIRRKIEESNIAAERSLVNAYTIVAKYSAANEVEKIIMSQFKENLYKQINFNLRERLKTEEWLIEGVGLGILRMHNLLPSPGDPKKVKDVYEAFLRYDDKPMITGYHAVQESIQRYCINGEVVIATGYSGSFERMFYKEPVNFFDVTDETYWLVDKTEYKIQEQTEGKATGEPEPAGTPFKGDDPLQPQKPQNTGKDTEAVKKFKSLTIAGKVPMENYMQIFTSFINPLRGNNVEIEVKITAKTTKSNPITENSQQYKITKESAAQLGLSFDAEE